MSWASNIFSVKKYGEKFFHVTSQKPKQKDQSQKIKYQNQKCFIKRQWKNNLYLTAKT